MAQQSRFSKEPPYSHGQAPKTAVLLCNLGTPEAPESGALRRYLAEFLSDPRVVEIPKWLWLIILHGIILRVRPAKSAQKYAVIWTPEGSPLKVWTQAQAELLQARFDAAGESVLVRYSMRYGQPSVAKVMEELRELGVTRVLILPAYPQYCAATTASVFDAVYAWAKRARFVPELRFINHYHDQASYISALGSKIRAHWAEHSRSEMLIMSFHGVPERTLLLGDPYHCECLKTARLLAEHLGLEKSQYRVTFQSRFGKAKWLEPYTEPTVRALAREGVKHIQVVCPGFTSDCLETLEEIAMEVCDAYLEEGGERFEYITCLNNDASWIDALSQVAHQHLQGWDLSPAKQSDLSASRAQALSMGAKD